MLLAAVKTRLRRFQHEGRHPMLTALAARSWHSAKNLADYIRFPAVRVALESNPPTTVDAQIKFVMDGFGGTIRPIQDRREIAALLEHLRSQPPRTVVEIGTARGGTLFLLCQAAAADAFIVSLDLPYGRNGGGFPKWKEATYARFARPRQQLQFLRGNSHDPASRTALRTLLGDRQIDFLMIDADHSYDGVRQDFEMYAPLVASDGLIALHDIRPNRHDPSIDVHRFWQELTTRFETEEIIGDPGAGTPGIGLVRPALKTTEISRAR